MRRILAGSLILAVLAGCAPSTGVTQPSSGGGAAPASQGPKRIVIAMAGDPPGLSTHINPAGTATPGLPELTEMIAPGLSSVDSSGQRVPVLAAAVGCKPHGS